MEDPDSAKWLEAAMKVPLTVSFGPMGSLLRQLHSPDSNHGIQDLREGVDKLCVSLMKLVSEEPGEPSFTAKWWIKEAREVLYDTHDFITDPVRPEDYSSQLMLRVKGVSESFPLVPAAVLTSTQPVMPLQRLPVPSLGNAACGLDDKKLVDLLAFDDEREKQLKVVPIFGVAGVGKTRAAAGLYRKFGRKFQCKAFLRVSRNPDMRRLLTNLLSQIQAPPAAHDFTRVQDLIDSANKHLQAKRFFVIIDDIWTTSVWYIIRRAFPDGDCRSRIVTTTQMEDVALACCSYEHSIFNMGLLNRNQSRNLLFNRLYRSEGECPPDLEKDLDGIISECGDLPLAIVTIASLLASEASTEHIEDCLSSTSRINPTFEGMEEIFSPVVCSSEVVSPRDFKKNSSRATVKTSSGMKEIMNLIYSKLPSHLKTYLLYLSMYPEDYVIKKGDFVKQCVAEGFLSGGEKTPRSGLEETAGGYFDELVRRGMIQPLNVHLNDGAEVLSYKVGHLVLDFIRRRSMEENFVTVVDYLQATPELVHGEVRRLSIQTWGAKRARIPASWRTFQLRSLVFCGLLKCVPSVVDYGLLRVLILHIWADEDENIFDLTRIDALFWLRYLKIKCNIKVQLPDKIGQLKDLETLEVPAIVGSIPSDIGELCKLCTLKISVSKISSEDIDILKGLPVLSALSLSVHTELPELIVFERDGFQELKYFKFMCIAPIISFKEGAMCNVRKFKLGFNANRMQPYLLPAACLHHLTGLQEITAKIGGYEANILDAEHAFRTASSKIPGSPIIRPVQRVDCKFYGEDDKTSVTQDQQEKLKGIQEMSTKRTLDIQTNMGTSSKSIPGLLVSASTGAMGSVLEKLGIMLADKYELYRNVHEDIESLRKELEAMHAFLTMMAKVEKPDEQAKHRMHAVREMSYEIEDKIDEFMTLMEHEPTSKSSGGLMEIFRKIIEKIEEINIRHKIAKDVKDIKNQVKEINETYKRYKIDGSSRPTNEIVDPRICAIYKDVSELVGIVGPRDELVKWLTNKDDKLKHQPKVLSIVGYGGLGKTTLAKQVYDKIGATYECRAFVSISRSPDMSKILSSILSQLRNKDDAHAGADPQLIVNQIRDFLKDRRYFIVIDDIWNTQTWQTLNCALIKNSCDSVILTTTRIHDVANSCCSSQRNLVYKIQPLDVIDSKRLFFKRIFGCEEECPSNLKETAEGILKKCGGLPLAINAISSLLATGKTKEEWDHVHSSIGFAKGKSSDIDTMDYILSLSYFDLPLHLRSCLLYLTMFPEDYNIDRGRLVLLWISEGFIHSKDEEDLFQLGDTYFHELVNRSLVQPVNIGRDDKAKSCRVHNTILDFLLYKSKEENFSTLLSEPLKPGSRVRRLSLMGNEDQENVEQLDLSHARSLICSENVKHFPSLAKSNALRVLDLNYCRELENHHLKDIGRLFQLRHLNICFTRISELPREIGDLRHLRTLDASESYLFELPESVTRLQQLVQLIVPYETKFPDGIGNMKKLRDLGIINVFKQSVKFVEELGKLTNLKKLEIEWDTRESSGNGSFKEENKLLFFSSLRKLETHNLTTTRISFELTENDATFIDHALYPALTSSIRDIDINGGQLRWTSKWLASLVNLEILSIGDTVMIGQQDVDMIGSITTLLDLSIFLTGPKPIIISGTRAFEQLHKLFLVVTNDFVFKAGAMPNLKNLVLNIRMRAFKSARGGCVFGFDFGMHHLSSLCTVCVYVDCFRVRAEDVEAVECTLKSMINAHPNRLTVEMDRTLPDYMLRDDEEFTYYDDYMLQDDDDDDRDEMLLDDD